MCVCDVFFFRSFVSASANVLYISSPCRRFNFIDCVQVLVNIGLEPSSSLDIDAETMSYLTPLEVAISSEAVDVAAFLASKGARRRIDRPIPGYRSVLDADFTTKFPWIAKMGEQPEDFAMRRVTRAVDDRARNLGVNVEMLNGSV